MHKYKNYVAIIPTYDIYANNCTRIIHSNGEETILPIAIQDFIDEMHFDFKQNFKTNATWASQYLFQKKHLPICLDREHAFFTFKARSGADKRHGCFGYISLFALSKLEHSTIHLTNGQTITTHSTYTQLRKFFISAFILYCVSLFLFFTSGGISGDFSSTLPTLIQSFYKNRK